MEDVVYVIDPGLSKGTTYSAHTNIAALETMQISRSNVQQRRGRAGRCRPGKFYKLYSEYEFRHEMTDHELPEMLRTPVEELCLQAKALRLPGNLLVEQILQKAISPPLGVAVDNAVTLLTELGAFKDEEVMTPLGYKLSQLPIHPCLGKMLLLGSLFTGYSTCKENESLLPLISICSTLSFKSPFTLPFGKEKEADRARKNYGQGLLSDHMLFAKVLKEYDNHKFSTNRGDLNRWLDKNFLSKKTLEMTEQIQNDLQRHLRDLKLNEDAIQSNSGKQSTHQDDIISRPLLSAILCASLSISFTSPTSKKICSLHGGEPCSVHPSSLLSMIESAGNDRMLWRTYKHLLQDRNNDKIVEEFVLDTPDKIFIIGWFERLKTSDVYLRDCTLFSDPLPLLLLLPGVHQRGIDNGDGQHPEKEKSTGSFANDTTIFEVMGGKSSQGGDVNQHGAQQMLLLKVRDTTTASLLSSLRTKLSSLFDAVLSSTSSKGLSASARTEMSAVFNGLTTLIEKSHSLYLTDVNNRITDPEILEVRHLHNSAQCEVLGGKEEGEDIISDLYNPDDSFASGGGGRKRNDRESWRNGRGRKQGRGSSIDSQSNSYGGRYGNRW